MAKIFGFSKLKAFADDKMNMAQELKFAFEMVENIIFVRQRKLILIMTL